MNIFYEPFLVNIRPPLSAMIFLVANVPLNVFLVCESLIVGLWLDDVFGESILARIGGLLTVYGLFTVWLSIEYSRVREMLISMNKQIPDVGKKSLQDYLGYAARIQPDTSPHGQATLAAGLYQIKRAAEIDLPILHKITSRLVAVQFLIAGTGTMVWIFGDWIANFILHCEKRVSC